MELAVFGWKLNELGFVLKDNNFVYRAGSCVYEVSVELSIPQEKVIYDDVKKWVVSAKYHTETWGSDGELSHVADEQIFNIGLESVFEWLQKKSFRFKKA